MSPVPMRADSQALARLDALRPQFERLSAERIRAEGDIERLGRELEAAREAARHEFGTDDAAEIARAIGEAQARNAAKISEFTETLRAIEARLSALDMEA